MLLTTSFQIGRGSVQFLGVVVQNAHSLPCPAMSCVERFLVFVCLFFFFYCFTNPDYGVGTPV